MTAPYSHIPEVCLQPPSVDFIENHVNKYHPAFGVPPSYYSPAHGGWIVQRSRSPSLAPPLAGPTPAAPPPKPYTDEAKIGPPPDNGGIRPRPLAEPAAALKFWDQLFDRAMLQFTDQQPVEPEPLTRLDFRIRDKKDWTSVFDNLEAAKEKYANPNGTFKAGFRKVYRKMADNAEPVKQVTKLVPNNDYVTPVLGIVQMLLEAAQTASKVRDDVLNGFNDIDLMFSQIELFLSIYRGDQNIERASVRLIAATFHAVELAIGFFLKRAYKRMFSATFRGEDYEQALINSLQTMKDQTEVLIREAKNSEHYELSNAMREVLAGNSSILGGQQELRQEINQFRKEIRHELRDDFMGLLEQLMVNMQEQNARIRNSPILIPVFTPPPMPAGPTMPPPSYIVPKALLDLIDIPDLSVSDLEYIQEMTPTKVPPHEEARAQHLIRNNQLKRWLVAPSSSQLLVHGNYTTQRFVSGLSLFVASLAESLEDRGSLFIPLTFFCGLHVDSETDEYTGGRVMIESLICQLLCRHDFGATLTDSDLDEELIEDGDIEELCCLFMLLISRLPPEAVVFCLLDGMVYYEREEFAEEMVQVVETILRLSYEQVPGRQATIKALLTSPTRTTVIRSPFRDDQILSMESIAGSGLVASKERLERELREAD